MQTQLIIILSVTVALTFVVALVSIGLVIHKAVNAQEIRRRQRLYTHYSEKFAEVLLVDLPPLPSNARTSAVFKQYETLLIPIKKELEALPPVEARLHREMLRGVLVDFARDLSGDAIDRLIYCFYSLDFVSEQIELLKHKHWWVRAQAARDLGLLRTRRALAALTAALEDPHQDVRDQARQAIASLAGVESLRTILRLTRRMSMWTALELSISVQQYGEETVPYLVEGLDLPDQSVVLFCIEMLAVIGFVSAVDPLRRLAKTYPSITVRAKAIEAMGRLGDQRSEDLLVSFIRDPNPALRLKALEALGRIGAPAALPALIPRLEHGTLQEQIAAARAIAATGPTGTNELHRVAATGSKRQRAVCLHVLEERGGWVTTMFEWIINSYLLFVVLYFVGVNVSYTVMMILSLREILKYMHHNSFSDYRLTVQSELAIGVSVLAPAYNEEATVVESVRSLLKLNYGHFEVIVINDGSKDRTLQRLIDEFGLYQSNQIYAPEIPSKRVRGIYRSRVASYKNLVIVDKENGGKADALNVGINVARYELVCVIDADSILEEDALQKVVKPFLEDHRVVAAGGIVRIANGCEVKNGRVVRVGLSTHFLPLFQVVEYFRAFLSGRMAWLNMNALLIISGAFGLFRRQAVIDVGGYRTDTVGEDMEIVVRMHRTFRERRRPYRVIFVPDPVCWTEAPESIRILQRQRNRWHRGLMDVMRFHGKMLFNPRYGAIGMSSMPYYLFIELLGPVFEFIGYIATIMLFVRGTANLDMAILFFVVSLLYGVMFSVGGVLLEEISFRRYPNPKHLVLLLFIGVLENFGYRQLTAWWRIRAFFDYARGQRGWGKMQRKGFRVGT